MIEEDDSRKGLFMMTRIISTARIAAALAILLVFSSCGRIEADIPVPRGDDIADSGVSFTDGDDSWELENIEGEDSATSVTPIRAAIVSIQPGYGPFQEASAVDFQQVFTAENGYDVQYYFGQYTEDRLTAAKAFVSDGVDYLIINTQLEEGIDSGHVVGGPDWGRVFDYSADWEIVMQAAQEADVKVFLFGTQTIDYDHNLFEAAIVRDDRGEGEKAVDMLMSLDLPEYNIVSILFDIYDYARTRPSSKAIDSALAQRAPFDEAVSNNDNWNLVVRQYVWDHGGAIPFAQSIIESGESFNVIYADSAELAYSAVAALHDAGITTGVDGDVVVLCHDNNSWILNELLMGNLNYVIGINPF